VVLVLDLDGFKSINDRFGHLAGNKVLKMISEGLRVSCREYDCVARMGGDEFVVILAGSTREAVAAKAMQYREVTREVGLNFCHEDILSVSVGEACFRRTARRPNSSSPWPTSACTRPSGRGTAHSRSSENPRKPDRCSFDSGVPEGPWR
jgi:diguanylate cyclase (GGDEF)-like protein